MEKFTIKKKGFVRSDHLENYYQPDDEQKLKCRAYLFALLFLYIATQNKFQAIEFNLYNCEKKINIISPNCKSKL